VKMLVVACNSIEVSAIDDVARQAGLPVVGVIEPGVRAAVRATRNSRVGLIGTEATVASGAYDRAMASSGADVSLFSRVCPAFVEYVERGETWSQELREIAEDYLRPLRAEGIDALILGCTHYPLLSGLIQMVLGEEVVLVSSAAETAKDVYRTLVESDLEGRGRVPRHEFLSTGDPERFQRVAEIFLGPEIREVRAAHLEPVGGRAWS
jgi:glutamate racemase